MDLNQKLSNKNSLWVFRLTLLIIRGEKLPVADITTSDPYVIVEIGDKKVGQTDVVFKSLDPEWNKLFQNIEMTHTDVKIIFRVMDKDRGKNDDPLGIIEVPVSSLSCNSPETLKLPLQQLPGGSIKASGMLHVKFLLERNKHIIDVVPKQSLSEPFIEIMHPILMEELNNVAVPDAVLNGLKSWEGIHLTIDERDIIRDLLLDTSSIANLTNSGIANSIMKSSTKAIPVLRVAIPSSVRSLTSPDVFVSTQYDLGTSDVTIGSPSKDFKLSLSMMNKERHVLKCSSYIQLWIWLRILRFCFNCQSESQSINLPSWAESSGGIFIGRDMKLSFHCPSKGSTPYTDYEGMIRISILTKPLTLEIIDPDTQSSVCCIDLSELNQIAVSHDKLYPSEYAAQVEIEGFTLNDSPPDKRSIINSSLSDPHFEYKFECLKGSSAMEGPPVVTSKGFGCCSFLFSSTIRASSAAVLVANDITNVVSDTVTSVADVVLKEEYKIVVRTKKTHFQTNSYSLETFVACNESFYFDFNMTTLQSRRNTPANDLTPLESNKSAKESAHHLSNANMFSNLSYDEGGYYFFLYKSNPGSYNKLIGCHYGSLNTFLQSSQKSGRVTTPMTDSIGRSLFVVHDDNITPQFIGFTVEIIGVNLNIASNVSTDGWNFSYRVAFADCNGSQVNSKLAVKKSVGRVINRNGTVSLESEDRQFILTESDGLDKADYVRIDILSEGSLKDEKFASSYVAIEAFTSELTDLYLPLTVSNRECSKINKLIGSGFSIDNGAIGLMHVTIGRTIKKYDTTEDKKTVPYLSYSFKIENQSVYSRFWDGEVVVGQEIVSERVSVSPGFDGLLLFNTSNIELTYGNHIVSESNTGNDIEVKVGDQTNASVINQEATEIRPDEILLSLYENQRSNLSSWSSDHLLSFDYKMFSDEKNNLITGAATSLSDILPPVGYEWFGDWIIDIDNHQQSDPDGWKYSSDFLSLYRVWTNRGSETNKNVAVVRSRRWLRHAIKSNPSKSQLNHVNLFTAESNALLSSRYRWRETCYRENPNVILSCCKERLSLTSPVFIPYSQLSSISFVSDSILALTVEIHRYLGTTSQIEADNFRPITIEIFLTGCPARKLKDLLTDRQVFSKYRQVLSSAIQSERDSLIQMPRGLITRRKSIMHRSSNSLHDSETLNAPSGESNKETALSCQLSPCGSVLIDFYGIINVLADSLASLKTKKASREEFRIVELQLLRAKLYCSALFGACERFVDSSYFAEASVRAKLQKDFLASRTIEGLDDTELEINKIEYLLDSAESRLLEYALRGWKYRGDGSNVTEGTVQSALQIVINEYFIELINVLGKYFESVSTSQIYLKGLKRKILVLISFMSYNDRLETCSNIALRAYNCQTTIPPRLSIVLNINVLIALYASVLQEDMSKAIDNALNVWIDVDKNTSGNRDYYSFPLPWIPARSEGVKGYFLTQITQDSLQYLQVYLNCARMNENDIAPSFRQLLGIIDSRIQLCYASAMQYLNNEYWNAYKSMANEIVDRSHVLQIINKSLNATNVNNEQIKETVDNKVNGTSDDVEQKLYRYLDEKCDWLCSVGNDSHRSIGRLTIPRGYDYSNENSATNTYDEIQIDEIRSSKEVRQETEIVISETSFGWKQLQVASMDSLAGLTMQKLSLEYQRLFDSNSVYHEWKLKVDEYTNLLHEAFEKESTNNPDIIIKHFPPKPVNTTDYQFLKTIPENRFMKGFINALIETIESYRDGLLIECYFQLVLLCFDKVIALFYSLIYEANNHDVKWKYYCPEVTQLLKDIRHVRSSFEQVFNSIAIECLENESLKSTILNMITIHNITAIDMRKRNTEQWLNEEIMVESVLSTRLIVLDQIALLLSSPVINKSVVQKVFEPVLTIAPHRREITEEIVTLLMYGISLRYDSNLLRDEGVHVDSKNNHGGHRPEHNEGFGIFNKKRTNHEQSTESNQEQNQSDSSETHTKRGSVINAIGGIFRGRRPSSRDSSHQRDSSTEEKFDVSNHDETKQRKSKIQGSTSSDSLNKLAEVKNDTAEWKDYEYTVSEEIRRSTLKRSSVKRVMSIGSMLNNPFQSDADEESVDYEIISTFLNNIQVWKYDISKELGSPRSNTNSIAYDDGLNVSVSNNQSISRFNHQLIYYPPELMISYVIRRKEKLLTDFKSFKTMTQLILFLSSFSSISFDELYPSEKSNRVSEKNRTKKPLSQEKHNKSHGNATPIVNETNEWVLQISNIYITGLIVIDSSKPLVYMDFHLGDKNNAVSSVVHTSTLHSDSPDWRNEPTLEIVLSGNLHTLLHEPLIGSVKYKGHLYGHLDSGNIKINITTVDISQIKGEYILDMTNADQKIQKAMKKLSLSAPGGKLNPTRIGLTVRLVERPKTG